MSDRTISFDGCTRVEAVERLRAFLIQAQDDHARAFETDHLVRGDLAVDAIDDALAVLTDEAAIDDVLVQFDALLDRERDS